MLRLLTRASPHRRLQVPQVDIAQAANGLQQGSGAVLTVSAVVHDSLFHVLFDIVETQPPCSGTRSSRSSVSSSRACRW